METFHVLLFASSHEFTFLSYTFSTESDAAAATAADDDDDDDDDDYDDELILWYGWLTKDVALFSAGTTVRDPYHCKSPTHREQDLNLCRTWVQTMMNEVVQ